MATVSARQRLELRGKTITTFIAYEAAATLREMQAGETLELVTEDQEAITRDPDAWCRAVGHSVVSAESDGGQARFLIEKGAPRKSKRTAAFVISDPGVEKLLSARGFALAAALEGDEVHI
jgi:TusA-related sulfurtransferase